MLHECKNKDKRDSYDGYNNSKTLGNKIFFDGFHMEVIDTICYTRSIISQNKDYLYYG